MYLTIQFLISVFGHHDGYQCRIPEKNLKTYSNMYKYIMWGSYNKLYDKIALS